VLQSAQVIAAEMAEEDYRSDKELTGFDAFSEEERNDDDEPDRTRSEDVAKG
jgi:hypothetical protein